MRKNFWFWVALLWSFAFDVALLLFMMGHLWDPVGAPVVGVLFDLVLLPLIVSLMHRIVFKKWTPTS